MLADMMNLLYFYAGVWTMRHKKRLAFFKDWNCCPQLNVMLLNVLRFHIDQRIHYDIETKTINTIRTLS